MEIFLFAAARQPGENVIGTEKKFPLGEVHQQRNEIVSAALNFHVVAFGDAIDAHVHLGAARHPDGDLLAQEEVRVAPQNLHAVDEFMAGYGDDGHAHPLQPVIYKQQRDWQNELIQFQDHTDRLDVLRKLTGIRIQQQYNSMLQNGWTLGSTHLLRVLQTTIRIFHRPLMNLLEKFWREKPADLLISVIPHFNRQICESWTKVYPGRPFVTIITDLADFPPRFWIEPIKDQYVIAGTEKAADQERAMGHDDSHIFPTSGMILRPDFYVQDDSDAVALRREMGLREGLATSIVLFRRHGSKARSQTTETL